MKMNQTILEISNLSKSFDGLKAVDSVSLSIEKGTVASIIGPNGAGKTTLFNLINGFIRQDSGFIRYKGARIDELTPTHRAILGIGRLWQDIRLFKNMTVLDNLLVAKKNNPGERVLRNFFSARAVAELEKHNLDSAEKTLQFVHLEHKRNALAQDLSYGQQKLLALGRLLMNNAELLLLDEPLAGVNPKMINEIQELIRLLVAEGKTVLLIEHNLPKAMEISDVVYVMDEGRIELAGKPSDVSEAQTLREIYLGV